MGSLSASYSEDLVGLDGALMIVVQDILRDPAKELRFRAALKQSENGVPLHVCAIKAINAAYGTEIPLNGVPSHRPYVDKLLTDLSGKRLAFGLEMDHTFLNMLASYGPNRMNLLQRYRG